MIVAWTGHRPDIFCDPLAGRAAVDAAARQLDRSTVDCFLVGGQRGVDTWAALAATDLGIPFTLVLPLPVDAFTRDWSAHDCSTLELMLSRAATVRTAIGYSDRNRVIAAEADLLIAVWTRIAGGGTAETIAFARAAGTPIREIVLEPSPTAASAHGRGV